jgi:hypothetical protein
MNIHTSNQLTNAISPPNRSLLPRGFVLMALALASLALSPAVRAQSTDPAGQCSPQTLSGTYMSLVQSGTLNGLPVAQVNRLVADGMGNITGSGTLSVNGVISFPVITATYTVNSDCTGTLTSVPAGSSQNFVIRENGTQVFFIVTANPAGTATIAGEAVRISRNSN